MIEKIVNFVNRSPALSQIHGVWVEVKANGSDPDSRHFLCNSRASGFVYARYG